MDFSKQLYEAASLNDTGQLKKLLEQEIQSKVLEDSLSKVCMQLRLNRVDVTEEVKLILDRKLHNLRLFCQLPTDPSSSTIHYRIGFVINLIHNLQTCEGNDEMLILYLSFITKQIFTLKKLLKSTYDRLPWEEIEFCVLLYIKTFNDPDDMALFSRAIINKSNLIGHLKIFARHLVKVQEYVLDTEPQELSIIPNLKRKEVVDKIITKYPEFQLLYDEYEILRDINSLNIILNYVELVENMKFEEKHIKLILMRSLQQIGEHLKNTLESPKLSESAIANMHTYFSINIKDIMIQLGDSLSHNPSPSRREELLENLENDILIGIKTDIAKIGEIVYCILTEYKIKILRDLMEKFLNTNEEEVMKEVVNATKNFDIYERNIKVPKNNDVIKLKNLLSQLRSKLDIKFGYIPINSLFDSLDAILTNYKEKKQTGYEGCLACFGPLNGMYNLLVENSHDECNLISNVKFIMKNCFSNFFPEIIKPFKSSIIAEKIALICMFSHGSQNIEVMRLVQEILYITEFEMDRISSIEKFGRTLWRADSEKKISNKDIEKISEAQKHLKLAQLRDIFNGITYSEYKSNKNLQAALQLLLLDLIPMLKYPNFKSRSYFLDDYNPIIIGQDLRNHLAHNDAIAEILLDSNADTYLFAETLLNVDNSSLNLKDCSFPSLPNIEETYLKSLDVLNKKQNMFVALKEDNFEAFSECLGRGADVRSRDMNMSTCLHFAMVNPKSLKLIEFLWMEGLSSKLKNSDHQSPLHIAAVTENPDVVEFLLKNFEIEVNDVDIHKRTASHLAALKGNEPVLNILLTYRADLTKRDKLGHTALQYAVISGKQLVVEVFFKNDLFYQLNEGVGGMTTLHIASEYGMKDVVDYLISKKLAIDARQEKGGTPLHLAALNGHLEIVKLLIRSGADVNSRNLNGVGAIHFACETDRQEIVKVLIEHGADLNEVSHTGHFAPIHYVTKGGFTSILKILLENNVNINLTTHLGLTPLHFAAQGGHLGVVKMLLNQKDIKVNSADIAGMTPLHEAASNGNTEIVKLLIENGAKVNCKDMRGMNLLHLAAKFGHEAVVDILLANKVSVQARTIDEDLLPLHLAAESGNENIIRKLINERSDINALTADGSNCLHIAIRERKNIIDLLLQEGIKVNVKTKNDGITPLHGAVLVGNLKIVEALLKGGSHVNAKDLVGNTPIHYAVEGESNEISLLLLQNGADFTIKNKKGKSAFLIAVKYNRLTFIELCINTGQIDEADIYRSLEIAISDEYRNNTSLINILLGQTKQYRDFEGNTLLHKAAFYGRTDLLEMLLNKGISVDAKNMGGRTPLFSAAMQGHEEFLKLLLEKGAKINTQDREGSTPLHVVSLFQKLKCAKVLLEHGADTTILDDRHRLAVEEAVHSGSVELIKLFLEKNKNFLNGKGYLGLTLLHIASQLGKPEVVRFLLKEGADMHSKNEKGSMPIHIAARDGYSEIIDIFIDNGMDLDVRGVVNSSLLYYAASGGKIKVVEYLLARNCNVNSVTDEGSTPLHVAILHGYKDIAQLLLDNGALLDMNHPVMIIAQVEYDDEIKELLSSVSNLFSSIAHGKIAEIKAAIKNGVPLNFVDINKGTPLHFAVYKGKADIVEVLLRNKASTDATHKNGWTPLHYAVKHSHENIVFLLLMHGAKYNMPSGNGKKPMDFAVNGSLRNLLQLLEDCFEGVHKNNSNIIRRLKKITVRDVAKAVMRARDKYGETLIATAIKNNYSKINELEGMFQENIQVKFIEADLFMFEEKYDEAKKIYVSILQQRSDIFGVDNPATLSINSKIASILYKQQLYEQAFSRMQETYEKLKKILGFDHERTLIEKGGMALILHRQGKNEEALAMFEEVREIQEKMLPCENEESIKIKQHMALVLMNMNKLDQALDLHNAALEFQEKKYGIQHPTTMVTKNNMALTFFLQGKCEEALNLFREVYEVRKLILGPYHSDTLRTLHNRINVLKKQKKYDQAFDEYTNLLKCQKQHLGPRHLDTLETQFQMADIQMARSKYFSAFKIFREIKDLKIAILGTTHETVAIIQKLMQIITEVTRTFGIHSNLDNFIENLVSRMNTAAKNGDTATIENLLRCGVDVGEKDTQGRNSLHFAVDGNKIDIVKFLLKNKADVTEKTNKGNTVLHTACSRGSKEITELILNTVKTDELGSFINTATATGKMTALHVAAKQGSSEIVRILLKKGAIYNAVNKDGKTPEDLTKDEDVKKILQLTKKHFVYLENSNLSLISQLLKLTKNDFLCVTNARNLENHTLLNLVILQGNVHLARTLTEAMMKMNNAER